MIRCNKCQIRCSCRKCKLVSWIDPDDGQLEDHLLSRGFMLGFNHDEGDVGGQDNHDHDEGDVGGQDHHDEADAGGQDHHDDEGDTGGNGHDEGADGGGSNNA